MDNLSWEDPLTHRMKVERNLNFSTISNEEDEYGFSRKKTARDPMSHRIIEKRRRDRMNNCLADLSRLVPTNYLKKGRGRIEKTEIIEMAIKHLKHLQAHPCKDPANCEVAKATDLDHKRQYKQGYNECLAETVRFLMEVEGLFSGEGICVRMINHLHKHLEKVAGGMNYSQEFSSEESKIPMFMEMDSHSDSCFPTDVSSSGGVTHENHNHSSFSYENRHPDISDMKQEEEVNAPRLQPTPPSHAVKVTSQLREMLQNPGLPKDATRSANGSHVNSHTVNGSHNGRAHSPPPMLILVPPSNHGDHPTKLEESCSAFKFKNNIKHRFNNDLRHHTVSPSMDQAAAPEDDHNNNRIHVIEPYPLKPACPPGSEDRLLLNGTGHAFSPYQASHPPPSEPAIKPPPDRPAHSDGVPFSSHQWDSPRAETASSCGSNSPPPSTTRSNGSSSGYSTNGETNPGPLLKSSNGRMSPYRRTPDRLSNRTPSPPPLHQAGVPIFALHPKGSFYIPLTIDSALLIPYMVGMDDLAPVLHPISISVNLGFHSLKVEKLNGTVYKHHTSFLMEKFHDRYAYPDKPLFYPCPPSPPRNACT